MVSFATCSVSVDEAFACLFTHAQTRVCIYHNSTHSLEPGLSEFQDRTAIHSGWITELRPSSLPQTGVVSHHQARPFRISRPSHSVLISNSRWVQQGSQVGSGQNSVRTQNQVQASQDHHQAIRPVRITTRRSSAHSCFPHLIEGGVQPYMCGWVVCN